MFKGLSRLWQEGGKLIHYKDLDKDIRTSIWQTYASEFAKNGIEAAKPDAA